MKFEWDESKNRLNILKHGLDLSDARELFLGKAPYLVGLDARKDYGEDRWRGIGVLHELVVVVVVFTEKSDDTIRIISLRKASTRERKAYEEEIKNRLGAG